MEEDQGHSAGEKAADQGDDQQSNAHCIAEGEELHVFGDASCPVGVGPELWQTARTFYGICRKEREG